MTIELSRGKSRYKYQISATDPRMIQRKENRHNARWQDWRLCADADAARAALLRVETGGASEAEGEVMA